MTATQPKGKGPLLAKTRLVLRLLRTAPGVLLAAGRAYRPFRSHFIFHAVSEGMPEDLAREIAAELKPLRLARGFTVRKG